MAFLLGSSVSLDADHFYTANLTHASDCFLVNLTQDKI